MPVPEGVITTSDTVTPVPEVVTVEELVKDDLPELQ
jgi:hypothetical protein